jgi:hypothetical protein
MNYGFEVWCMTHNAAPVEAQYLLRERVLKLLRALQFHQASCATHVGQVPVAYPWTGQGLRLSVNLYYYTARWLRSPRLD